MKIFKPLLLAYCLTPYILMNATTLDFVKFKNDSAYVAKIEVEPPYLETPLTKIKIDQWEMKNKIDGNKTKFVIINQPKNTARPRIGIHTLSAKSDITFSVPINIQLPFLILIAENIQFRISTQIIPPYTFAIEKITTETLSSGRTKIVASTKEIPNFDTKLKYILHIHEDLSLTIDEAPPSYEEAPPSYEEAMRQAGPAAGGRR